MGNLKKIRILTLIQAMLVTVYSDTLHPVFLSF